MNRYWTRITVGALLVFGLGMTGLFAVRKGKAEVEQFLATVGSQLPGEPANLRFRLDGRSLGNITGIDVAKSGPGDVGQVHFRVALTDRADLAVLKECSLTARGGTGSVDRSTFRCADGAELDAGGLEEVGQVAFEPGSLTRPLYLRRNDVDRWRRSKVRSLTASLGQTGHGGVKAQGNFDVNSGGVPQRGSFSVNADSNGAIISVRDASGKALLDFRADHNGVNLNLRDKQGRNLLKLLADSLGASIKARN